MPSGGGNGDGCVRRMATFCANAVTEATAGHRRRRCGQPRDRGAASRAKATFHRGRIRVASALEDAVWLVIENALRRPDLLESQYRTMFLAGDGEGDLSGMEKSITRQLAAVKRREDRLVEAYSAEAVTLEQLKESMAKLRAERAELQRELAAIGDRRTRMKSLDASVQRIEEFCRTVGAGLDGLDFDGRRRLLELLVDRIDLAEGGSIVVHTVMPPVAPSGGPGELEELRLYHPEPVETCADREILSQAQNDKTPPRN